MLKSLIVFLILLSAGCAVTPVVREPAAKPVAPFTAGNKTPYEVFGITYEVMPDSYGYLEIGVASWYGKKFHGKLTSNGEVYDMYQLSAAHKSLPIPSMVKVTNLDNGRSVTLRINDRGPFHDNRIIDLSYAAAKLLGYDDQGIAPVVVEALDERNHPERFAQNNPHGTLYYLQLGAFSELTRAQNLQSKVKALIEEHGQQVDAQILQSEHNQTILHKVWLGPLSSEIERQQIAQWVESAQLGKPINVEVE